MFTFDGRRDVWYGYDEVVIKVRWKRRSFHSPGIQLFVDNLEMHCFCKESLDNKTGELNQILGTKSCFEDHLTISNQFVI